MFFKLCGNSCESWSSYYFSAAIPFQGGDHHINEQWPHFWIKYFQERGYMVIDCVRKKICQNENVQWYYAQNILLLVKEKYLEIHPELKREYENTATSYLTVVHPKSYLELASKINECSDPSNN